MSIARRAQVFLFAIAWVAFGLPRPADAQCPEEGPPVGCNDDGTLHWEHEEALFDMLSFDSGWLPAGSALQLRVTAMASSESFVSMDATSTTAWHDEPYPAEDGMWNAALSNRVSGNANGGRLRMDYGFSFRVFIRFNARVAGRQISFEREIDVPAIPMDLRIVDEANFDPFVFDPGEVAVMDNTEPIALLGGSLDDLVSLPSGVDGGIRLDVSAAGSLAYRTLRLLTEGAEERTGDNARVRFVPPSENGFSAAFDTALNPEGQWIRNLELLIEPNAFVEVLGRRFSIASFTLPVHLADDTSDIRFEADTLHVPLPDVQAPNFLRFEEHTAGEEPTESFLSIQNTGEAPLVIWLRDAPDWLEVPGARLEIAPSSRRTIALSHELFQNGTGTLRLFTSDPDTPEVSVEIEAPVREPRMPGGGVDASFDGHVDAGFDAGGPSGVSGGACGCSANPSPQRGLFILLLVGLLVSRRTPRRM